MMLGGSPRDVGPNNSAAFCGGFNDRIRIRAELQSEQADR